MPNQWGVKTSLPANSPGKSNTAKKAKMFCGRKGNGKREFKDGSNICTLIAPPCKTPWPATNCNLYIKVLSVSVWPVPRDWSKLPAVSLQKYERVATERRRRTVYSSLLHHRRCFRDIWYGCTRGSRRRAVGITDGRFANRLSPYRYLHDRWLQL